MASESDRIESDWAVQQLEALGYVKVKGKGAEAIFGLTDKGHERAQEIMLSRHDMMERLLIMLHCADLAKYAIEED